VDLVRWLVGFTGWTRPQTMRATLRAASAHLHQPGEIAGGPGDGSVVTPCHHLVESPSVAKSFAGDSKTSQTALDLTIKESSPSATNVVAVKTFDMNAHRGKMAGYGFGAPCDRWFRAGREGSSEIGRRHGSTAFPPLRRIEARKAGRQKQLITVDPAAHA